MSTESAIAVIVLAIIGFLLVWTVGQYLIALHEHRRNVDEMRRAKAEIERLDKVIGQMLDEEGDDAEEQR